MSKFDVSDDAPTGIIIHKRQADGSVKKFSADKKPDVKLSNTVDLSSHKPGTPYRFRHGWIPRAGEDVSKVTSAHVNGTRIHKSDAAAEMYGRGSKQHVAAIKRFGKGGLSAEDNRIHPSVARSKESKLKAAQDARVRASIVQHRTTLGPGKYSVKTDRASSHDYTEVKHTAAGANDGKVIGTVATHPKGGYITDKGSKHDTKAQAIAALKKAHANR